MCSRSPVKDYSSCWSFGDVLCQVKEILFCLSLLRGYFKIMSDLNFIKWFFFNFWDDIVFPFQSSMWEMRNRPTLNQPYIPGVPKLDTTSCLQTSVESVGEPWVEVLGPQGSQHASHLCFHEGALLVDSPPSITAYPLPTSGRFSRNLVVKTTMVLASQGPSVGHWL